MFNFFDDRDKRRKLGFLRQTLFLALFDLFELCLVHFKPYIASFNLIWKKKNTIQALAGEIFHPFPLSVLTSS